MRKYGGNRASENAVAAALAWFARHQSSNGQWDVDGYMRYCAEDPKCEPGTGNHTGRDGDVACTAYALLCYLGAGFDHQSGRYRNVVRRGIDWLLAQAEPNGLFENGNYAHSIATMAVAECFAMTGDERLRQPLELALARMAERQNAGGGWSYGEKSERNDASVTGWCVMAIKAPVPLDSAPAVCGRAAKRGSPSIGNNPTTLSISYDAVIAARSCMSGMKVARGGPWSSEHRPRRRRVPRAQA